MIQVAKWMTQFCHRCGGPGYGGLYEDPVTSIPRCKDHERCADQVLENMDIVGEMRRESDEPDESGDEDSQ